MIRDSVAGGPDFIAFMEIENAKVLEDLHSRHLRDLGYRIAAAAPGRDAPVRVGLLSRLPVSNLRSHEPASDGFPQRLILEVETSSEGRALTIFICHFKARSEGAEATEKSRVLSARLVRKRLAELLSGEPDREILVLGDLNENIDEYERAAGSYLTALLPAGAVSADKASLSLLVTGERNAGTWACAETLYSPWLDDPPLPGSYWYKGGWESLDHTLLSRGLLDGKGLTLEGFDVVRPPYLLDAAGKPLSEYSDHLPLLLRLKQAGKGGRGP